ncbi:MAG: hypothetical protein RSA29_17135 [Clostridium sp.]|uniref:hypothetical protein n=1 Tax=Clostridium sp. TaxID=1506 RepID=UPI00304168F4
MGKEIISLSIDESDIENVLESCIILDYNNETAYVDEFEVPYEYEFEVLTSTRKNKIVPDVIEIKGLNGLYKVIDKEDCLPDVGLLDYENKELGLNLTNVTLRELYKAILNKVL